uniref:Fiber protein Fb34 n=1 Tax=Rhizophora mucronata TaxID=61149 RepID=A0A2P2QQR5_RHIMU
MAVSVSILAIVTSLHLIAFVLAIGAERRRSSAKVVPDQYDERTYCVYGTDASTVYGLAAFGLLLISQLIVTFVTRCLCFGRGLVTGSSTTCCAIFFFIFSWISFLAAEACLLAGSARNAYHTKYRGIFGANNLSCATLRKGVFAAGAALTLLSLLGSILYYWTHSRADTGGWEKHQNEGVDLTSTSYPQDQPQRPHGSEFQKV